MICLGLLILFHDKEGWIIQVREIWSTTNYERYKELINELNNLNVNYKKIKQEKVFIIRIVNVKLKFKDICELNKVINRLLELKNMYGVGKVVC